MRGLDTRRWITSFRKQKEQNDMSALNHTEHGRPSVKAIRSLIETETTTDVISSSNPRLENVYSSV